mgnify:CR=1 FL=1
MNLGKLVGTLMLGLALGCSTPAGSGNTIQCKEGRVWYDADNDGEGECCPDNNSNGICDWVDDGTVPGQDAYSADKVGGDSSDETEEGCSYNACSMGEVKCHSEGAPYKVACSEVEGKPGCYVWRDLPCPTGTTCYDNSCIDPCIDCSNDPPECEEISGEKLVSLCGQDPILKCDAWITVDCDKQPDFCEEICSLYKE